METINLQEPIQELLHATFRAYNIRENDAVNIKTLKLILVGQVLEGLGLDWTYLMNLHKTHTPIHYEMAKELKQLGDEEVATTLAQMFVRNEKLARMVKGLTGKHAKEIDQILAVDGLSGNVSHGPNFDQKYYVGNLRYGNRDDPKLFFDTDPEYKRIHVQTVREMYERMPKEVEAPEKQIYEILRYSFMELARITLPELELKEPIQGDLGILYMQRMGKENIENLVKSLKFRGEKRTQTEREDDPEIVK